MEIDPHTGLEVLTATDCLHLLARQHLGRVGVCLDGRPLIFPVNYSLDGTDIVFRTNPGTKLHAAHGHQVVFEIDDANRFEHSGWSVLVTGKAEIVLEAAEHDRLSHLHVVPWGPGQKVVWVRVRAEEITGRRIPHA